MVISQEVNEDGSFDFNAGNHNAISIADVDALGEDETVTLTVGHGVLTLASTAGLSVTGDGTGSVNLTGTVANINAALDGLSYSPEQDFNGADTLTITADDNGNSGAGGSQTATASVPINVTAVNDAPVLTPAAPALISITEDDIANAGQTVTSFLGTSVGDADAGALEGIAVTAICGCGAWEYSLDGGANWSDFGTVAFDAALLLRDTDLIRFVPDGENGDIASFTYHAWDRTSGTAGGMADLTLGTGGATAFSDGSDTASIEATDVNDAPTVAGGAAVSLAAIDEDAADPPGEATYDLFAPHFADVDFFGTFAGVAISGNAATAAEGVWQWSMDGGGSWVDVPTDLSSTHALLLCECPLLRFVPAADFNGAAPALTVHLIDDSAGPVTDGDFADLVATGTGGTTPYSATTLAVGQTIDAVNDDPAGSPTAVLADGTEDTPYTVSAADLLAGFSDAELDSLSVATLTASDGSVVNNGDGTFTITPTLNFNGPVTLTYDVSDGNGGIVSDASQAYDLAAVNDAPTGAPTAVLADGTEDMPYTVNASDLLMGFSDVDGDTLMVADLNSSNGTVVDNGDGTFTITPSLHFTGLATLTYDVNDGHGGSVLAFYSSYIASGGETIDNNNGTSSQTFQDTLDQYAWSEIRNEYDSQSRQTSSAVDYDDGSRALVVYDVANQYSWFDSVVNYDAQDRLTGNNVDYDDGARALVVYDAADQYGWLSGLASYDGQGRLTGNTVNYDDGSRIAVSYDAADQSNWVDVRNDYDGQGRLVGSAVNYDNGTRAYVGYDPGNQTNWFDFRNDYDGQGRLMASAVDYDDGTRALAVFDTADQYNWLDSRADYDALGRLTKNVVDYDDGTRVIVNYDAANQYTWSSIVTHFDALGHQTSQDGTYDDGAIWHI